MNATNQHNTLTNTQNTVCIASDSLTRSNGENIRTESSEHVGHSFADSASECPLFERGQFVGDDAINFGQVTEFLTHCDESRLDL